MDDAEFQRLLAAQPPAPAATPAQQPQQQAAPSQDMAGFQAALPADLTTPGRDALGKPSDFLDAAAAGAGRAFLETKDTIFGEPAETDKSEARRTFEAGAKAANEGGPLNPVVGTIAQFGVGMLGAAKMLQAARAAVPAVNAGAAAVEATKAGAYALQSAGAAAVGAVAFDPHEERLSNLLEQVPLIGPAVFGWLAADPEDSAWEGRAKAAIESIGLDAALGGVFLAGTKVLKAMRKGSPPEAIDAAVDQLAAAQRAADEQQAARGAQAASQAAPEGATAREAAEAIPGAPAAESAPTATGEAPTGTATAEASDDILTLTEKVPGPAPRIKPVAAVSPEEAETIVAGIRSDLDAIDNAGSLQGAVDEGHVFGRGANIPWNKLNLPGEVDDFVARVADAIEPQIAALKGGEVLSDARVMRQVNGIASYFNMDPGTIVGRIQSSGQAASRMVADMEAAYLISNRMHTEAFNMASRISLGDFGPFANRELAMAEFQRQVTLAGSMLASGQSMRAAMGRGLRRLRPDFAIDPELVERLQALGGEKLLELFKAAAGEPKVLKRITEKTFLQKAADEIGFMIQNNLLWGFGTHVVNLVSNAYMLAGRPAERAIGALAKGNTRLAREQLEQVIYYPHAFVHGFKSVLQALKVSDSVIDPRRAAFVLEARGAAIRDGAFRPMHSLAGVLHNAYLLTAIPTRALTTSDELMKQTVYRSYVASKAWSEGVDAGLSGKALRSFIADKIDGAFDAAGRATNEAARQEARIATFSQDLVATGWGNIPTAGRTVRSAVGSFPALRLVLPFTQTPTNLFRYTVKMSLGFNMFQQEFNHAIRGKMGVEQQAQAIGQMALGTAALGAIAMSGLSLTGGGPRDPKVRAEKMATGWRPYSVVKQNADGSLSYFPIGRVDPIAMAFSVVADIMDWQHAAENVSAHERETAIAALGYSLIKQASNKTYMVGLSRAMDAFTDPERHLHRFTAGAALSLLPFSSGLRNYNPDPFLREVRTFVDGLMAGIPGLSKNLIPERNAFGEPIRDRTDFISVAPSDPVTAELQRMQSLGFSLVPPSPTIMGHTDLRDLTMQNGRNAWDVYQELAGKPTRSAKPLREAVGRLMATEDYRRAPDGRIDEQGTKLYILHKPVIAYRNKAEAILLRDPIVRQAVIANKRRVVDAKKAQEAPKAAPDSGAIEALRGIGEAFGLGP